MEQKQESMHNASPKKSLDTRYRKIFKRIIGAEMLEKHRMAKVIQADERETNDPLAAGCLKIDGRYCYDLHQCLRGILIATTKSLLFFPSNEHEKSPLFGLASIDMRYECIRSISAYRDPSVFVFTKRTRIPRQSSSMTMTDHHDAAKAQLLHEDLVGNPLDDPTLGEDEVFLCCCCCCSCASSGGPESPLNPAPSAQWFIIPRSSIEDLNNFIIGCDLGLTSVFEDTHDHPDADTVLNPASALTPSLTSSTADVSIQEGREGRSILNSPLGALIPRQFHSQDSNAGASTSSPIPPIHLLGRSFGRLIHRKSSTRRTKLAPLTGSSSGRRRPFTTGSSEEFFSDHSAIYCGADGARDDGAFFDKSPSSASTPSFSAEKEVFDVLRQASLEWELVTQEEYQQRCGAKPFEDEQDEDGEELLELDGSFLLSLPDTSALFESRALANRTQIHELFGAVPKSSQLLEWSLTFSTDKHGFSLKTLYRRCDEFLRGGPTPTCSPDTQQRRHQSAQTAGDFQNTVNLLHHRALWGLRQSQPCVLLIRDTADNLMGAYLSSHPRVGTGAFYGTGECFVFHWSPQGNGSEQSGDRAPSDRKNTQFKKYPWSGKNSFFISSEQEVLIVGCFNASSSLWIGERLNRGRTQKCDTFDSPPLTPSEDFLIHTLELWSLG